MWFSNVPTSIGEATTDFTMKIRAATNLYYSNLSILTNLLTLYQQQQQQQQEVG